MFHSFRYSSAIAAAALTVVIGAFSADAQTAEVGQQRIATQPAQGPTGTIAVPQPGPQQAGAATCSPASSDMCIRFQSGCDAVGGGLSSSPDGVTCSVSQASSAQLNRHFQSSSIRLQRGAGSADDVSTCTGDGSSDGAAMCSGFASACSTVGCGPSSNPDGTVSCACQ